MPPTRIVAAGYQVAASVHNRAMRVLEADLAKRLPEVEFDFTDSILDQGKTAGDLIKSVEDGTLTLCYQSTTRMPAHVPEFAILDLPFLFQDRATAYATLDGAFGDHLRERLEAVTPLRVLGWWDNGFRHLTNRLRPLRTPEDCVGLRIRTQFSETHQAAFRCLGMEPKAIDISELIASLEAQLVDAHDNALTNVVNFGIYRYHPYVTLSAHVFGVSAIYANADRLAELGPEVEAALRESAKVATRAQREFAAAEDAVALAKLLEEGVTVTELTGAEHAAFAQAVAPVFDAQRAQFGDEMFRLATGR
jgi:tripartite ATP-independent transporter DctP family solute receptor